MFSISYEKFTLSNGLEVILHEDHSLPIVAVNVWYHVGSKDEEAGKTGFAHLFEHIMFEGSKHHDRDYFEPLQKVGATINGSTTSDRTNYWENLPSNYLELALWLESDRMGFLSDALDQKRFDIQRDVVKNERRQSYENRPYGQAHLALQPALFPAPHRYNWPVIGSQEDLDAASLEDAKDFLRRFYAPSNASLAIAGDISPDDVRRHVERYFGDIPPGPPISRIGRMDSDLRGEMRMTLEDRVQLPRLSLVWPAGPMFGPDEAPLEVLATILGDGRTSRLHKILVYEKQIARSVRVYSYGQEMAGEFQIEVTASPGHSLDKSQEIVEKELDALRKEPPSEREMARARNRVESQHVRYMERIGGFGGRADQLNHYNIFTGDPGLANSDIERYKAVTPDEVVRVAKSVVGDNRIWMTVLPHGSKSASDSAVDRTAMPQGAAPRAYQPPVPKRERLSNGLNVLYVEKPGLPMAALGLVVKAGATTDPADRPGLAQMTSTMLPEGTTARTSQQIDEELEFLGSQLDSHAGREHMALSAESLTSHWPKVLEIMSDVIKDPTFPQRELDRVRKERLTDLRRVADDPTAIAQRAARAIIYGPDSIYGHPANGTEASLEAISREELVGHFQSSFAPAESTLIVVGDIDGDEVMAKVEASLGDWGGPATARDVHASPDLPPTAPATIYLADKPAAPQSVIRAGQVTIDRHHDDYQTMNLVNYVFGAQPTARLFMNLRQDKGYSYGYYSSIEWLTGPSALFAGGSVETGVTKESVVETLKEFADIRGERPVTEEEFTSAKDGLFRGLPSQFETQGQILQQLSQVVIFGLPDDYMSTVIPRLEAITLEDVHRVAAERIDDSHLAVLVVGDREAVEPGLSELGLPIVAVDYDGRHPG